MDRSNMELFPHVLDHKSEAIARVEGEAGLAKAEDHSGSEWVDYAYEFLCGYCRRHREVFPPDLWEAGLEVPSSPRAMGAVMQRGIREGIIRPIIWRGMICCKTNPYRHNATTPVYESIEYKDGRPF